MRFRRSQLVSCCALLACLTFASTISSAGTAASRPTTPPSVAIISRAPRNVMATVVPARPPLSPAQKRAFHAWIVHYWFARWVAGLPDPLAPVMACIRDAESGNYAEQSHLSAGSGAYQYVPGTWRTWFGRWATATGYTGPRYAYAFLAPAWVQDQVTRHVLTHGGQHNWDPRYGADSCTVGMR